jgi:hypothetical protein
MGFWIIQFSNHGTYCCSTHPSYRNWNSNCIFLTNKYQQEYVAHGNKARVITKVGTATLMTNLPPPLVLLLLSLPIANY